MEIKCKRKGEECYGVRELSLLYDISTLLIKGVEFDRTLTAVLEKTCKYLGAQSSFLAVLNRETNRIEIQAAYGLSEAEKSRGIYNIGEGAIGRVVDYKKPVIIRELSKSKLFLNRTRKDYTVRGLESSFICVPVIDENTVSGTLSVSRVFDPEYNFDDDVRMLSIIGSMLVQAIKARQSQAEEIARLQQSNRELRNSLEKGYKPMNMIGNSAKMRDVYNLIEMVSRTGSTVLIRGESGIGKELVADAIHYSSPRKDKPIIKVNCSALPDALIESELFGHEKGAFTGADTQRKGRFEMADGGTIFLDEIGDLPAQTQVKLLRVIQERQFERLGSSKTISVDVRIVAATNRNLEELIHDGKFREDLFYRINVFPIFIPPLRDRRTDIPALVDHFISKFNRENGTKIIRITTAAINMLMVYSWPGNIRELENVIERACILSTDEVLHSYNLPPTLQTADSTQTETKGGLQAALDRVECQLIREALTATKGNIAQAAKNMNVTERILGMRVKKYNLDPATFKV
jgi:Nif-specific regulatory protein